MSNYRIQALILTAFTYLLISGCASAPSQTTGSTASKNLPKSVAIEPNDTTSNYTNLDNKDDVLLQPTITAFEDIPEHKGSLDLFVDEFDDIPDEIPTEDKALTQSTVLIQNQDKQKIQPDVPTKEKAQTQKALSNQKKLPAYTETTNTASTNNLWQQLRNDFSLNSPKDAEATIEKFEIWFSKHPKYFERLTSRAYWFMPYVLEEVKKRNLPIELVLLPAIESAYRPDAVSKSKAVGLWQIISSTGSRFGLRQDWWMDGRQDLVQSTRAALDYLEYLADEFNNDWSLALAAYNAGEGNIRRAVKRNQKNNKPAHYAALKLRQETKEYVPKLFAVRNIVNNPGKYGISLKSIPNQYTIGIIDAESQIDMTVVSSLTGISIKQLQFLNKGYLRGMTPPNGPHHLIIPKEKRTKLIAALKNLDQEQRMKWTSHLVRKGEYLGRIARKYGVSVEAILVANSMTSNLIKPGQALRVPLTPSQYQYANTSKHKLKIKDGDRIYTVISGDTLWEISERNNTTLPEILRWNGLGKNTLLHPGQQLIVGRSS